VGIVPTIAAHPEEYFDVTELSVEAREARGMSFPRLLHPRSNPDPGVLPRSLSVTPTSYLSLFGMAGRPNSPDLVTPGSIRLTLGGFQPPPKVNSSPPRG